MVGKIPREESFLAAVKQTVTPEDLRIFFLLPFTGFIFEEKLLRKVKKAGIAEDEFERRAKHMVTEGIIMRYSKANGRAYERGNIAYMSEQQVRKKEDSPKRQAYADFMDALIEGETGDIPNRTPYYRVIPVESTMTAASKVGAFEVNVPVADPRTVLPLDIVSEMVKDEPLIAIAPCYCRSARKIVGKECEHPLETCFVFNEIAETLLEAGIARKLEQDEALDILEKCEQAGLVHFIDNVEGQIKSLCNCCACSCVIMSVIQRGGGNAGGPSRFIISYDRHQCTQQGLCAQVCPSGALRFTESTLSLNPKKCLGCGLCVSRCPEGALQLVPRDKYARIFPSNDALWSHISREAVVGMALNKLKRR
jgi:NAD-dependent dihydropyrimidine dehydrogenase PreA subunit